MTIESAQQEIARELAANESLLWYGAPRQGIRFRASDAFMIPFSLLWGGFAMLWEATVVVSHAPLLFELWGIPFVAIGVYMIAGRFWVDSMLRARTAYGLTNTRAIIVSGLRSRSVKSLPLKTLSVVALTERSDKSGTITLGPASPFSRFNGVASWPGSASTVTPAFEMVEDARTVYETVRTAQTAA